MNSLDKNFYDSSQKYLDNLHSAFSPEIIEQIEKLAKYFLRCWESGKNVFICGNGGSAANAIHIANDLHYGAGACGSSPSIKGLKVEALTSNSAVITCLGNDIGYENIFSHQLINKASKDDLLIVLSGSGNSQNIINASLECNLKKAIFISTDKATNPINLYGASKLAGEKLFLAANNIRGKSKTIFSVVRYGNVIGSRGSVIPIFLKCKEQKSRFIPVTHKDMTRFIIKLEDGVKFVLSSLDIMNGGEIFVPKIPSVKIVDLAKIILPSSKIKFIGIRPGEKLHEVLISRDESDSIYSMSDRYIVKPNLSYFKSKINKKLKIKKLDSNFEFSSNLKGALLNINAIKKKFRF